MKTFIVFLLSLIVCGVRAQNLSCSHQGNLWIEANCGVPYEAQIEYPITYSMALPSAPSGAQQTGVQYFWNTVGESPQLNSSSPGFVVNWASYNKSCGDFGTITCSAKVQYTQLFDTDENDVLDSWHQTYTCTLEIRMHKLPQVQVYPNPEFMHIECEQQEAFVLTAYPTECVGHFEWTVLAENGVDVLTSWQVQPLNSLGSQVNITPDLLSDAKIRVRAIPDQGCHSNHASTLTFDISRTCPDNVLYTTTVSSEIPEHTAAADYIEINPGVGNMLSLNNGDRKYMKAGKAIEIKPGFKTQYGSYFKAQIGPCNGCYAYRRETLPSVAVKVYPNPSTDVFHVLLEGEMEFPVHYTVIDLKGSLIETGNFNGPRNSLSLQQLRAGIYVLILRSGSFNQSVKLIKP